MTPEQRERLPKYARDELARLERAIRRAENAVAVAHAGPADSDTIMDPYGTWPRLLGRGPRVRFMLSEPDDARERWVDVHVERLAWAGDRAVLYVLGSDSIAVEPQSSNTLRVVIQPV